MADNFACKRVDGLTGAVKASTKDGAFPNAASITGQTVLMSGWFRKAVEAFDARIDDLLYSIPDFNTPLGMLMLDDQSILVAEAGTNSIVRVFDTAGKKSTIVASDLALLRQPKGIAVKPDGTILVVNVGTQELLQVDPGTGAVSSLAQHLPVGLFVPEGFMPAFTLSGVAVSGAGNIYLTSDIDNVIYELSPK